MSELHHDLNKLAPKVDMGASRELFNSRRVGTTSSGGMRWLMPAAAAVLLVTGVVGLWAVTRGRDATVMPADTAPPTEVEEAAAAPIPDFETIAVLETANPFGTIHVAADQDAFDAWRAEMAGAAQPSVDFSRWVAVAFTLPDDACPDILQRFDVSGDVWTPVFEPPPGGCNQPLIPRTYVVTVNRALLGDKVTFAVPGDAVYDYAATSATLTVGDPPPISIAPADDEVPVPTGVSMPLPERGTAESVMTLEGPVWVVHHDNGEVSAVAGVTTGTTDEDDGVTGLARLVLWDETSRSFIGRFLHDEYGRSINGPRSADLGGFQARVDGDLVHIDVVGDRRIAGQPLDVSAVLGRGEAPDLGPLFTIDQLRTLSYSGPVWRHVDATLVVQAGVGRLCDVPGTRDDEPGVPVPDLQTCGSNFWETTITSEQPEITSWQFSPVFAQFNEFGVVTQVVPMGGGAGRNDGPVTTFPPEQIEVLIEDVSVTCDSGLATNLELIITAGSITEVSIITERTGDFFESHRVVLIDGEQTITVRPEAEFVPGPEISLALTPADAPDFVLASHSVPPCG